MNLCLDVKNLTIKTDVKNLVHGINFSIKKGQTVGLVGESGSGKSLTALAIMRLLQDGTLKISDGTIQFQDHLLYPANIKDIRALRGNRIAMIFQEPMRSLNPLHRIETQIGEAINLHQSLPKDAVKKRVLELLEQVGIDRAKERLAAYPHQLSGGQRQRVMIAMALANKPDLLIADEPTTALDVTIQKQILDLLASLKQELDLAMLFITHDLKLVRHIADHVLVMQEGNIIESQEKHAFFANPQHEYSKALLHADLPPRQTKPSVDEAPLLEAKDLTLSYPLKKNWLGKTIRSLDALKDVDLRLNRGRTLGIVGESGSGKSSLALALLRLVAAKGSIDFAGQDISRLQGNDLRHLRQHMQIVFQDPYGSLSPRMMVKDIILEGLRVHKHRLSANEETRLISDGLQDVGLEADMQYRYPHEFSGGQRQRIAIARALILKPKLVIFDEPTSAMDVKNQQRLIQLILSLQEKYDLTYLVISHDISVIRAMADEMIVMHQGKIVESGTAEQVMHRPTHPYTKTLIAAALLEFA